QRIVPRSSARLPWTHASTSPGDVEPRATVCHPMPALPHPDFSGADDGIRTRDPNLGKVVLYQLSHVRVGHHCSYLRNFEKRRSARGLPPVWHVGQYWSDLPENATCRTRSPHTGQGCPVRPCTRSPSFFSFFSPAAGRPAERATASRSTSTSASCRRSTSSGVTLDPGLNGDRRAACNASSE